MAGAWGCPHESNDVCTKINNLPCDPGMKGCVLAGRYVFFNDDAKNERLRSKRARETEAAVGSGTGSGTDTDTDSATDPQSATTQPDEASGNKP